MSAPAWLPPLNSHEDYVTATKIEEAEDILDLVNIEGPKLKAGEDVFCIHVRVSVRFFHENDKMASQVFTENDEIGFPGLLLDKIFPLVSNAAGDLLLQCCSLLGGITRNLLTHLNIPFQLDPIRFLETNDTYRLQDEHGLMHEILSALSSMRSKRKSHSDIIPVRWRIFRHIIVSEDEYNAWTSWYTEKSRADPNFEHEYKAAIRRPRTTEELLYGQLVKFRAATASSIRALEVVTVENFDSTSNCSVCLDDLSPGSMAIRLPCSHVFHRDCIVKWLQESHMCPLCRFTLPTVKQ